MGKINLFEDKTYDKMEWLEKAVEPYVFPPNETLAKLPDIIELTFEDFVHLEKDSTGYGDQVSADVILKKWCDKNKVEIPNSHTGLINEWVEFQMDGDVEINFRERTLTGRVVLVKKKAQLDDEDIKENMKGRFYREFNKCGDDLGRLNEILDLLGCKEMRSSRSARYKQEAILEFMKQVIQEDKWRVKDTELIVSCGRWIASYVTDGNLAALSNFTRLKCMVHKGNPIYSMEETV